MLTVRSSDLMFAEALLVKWLIAGQSSTPEEHERMKAVAKAQAQAHYGQEGG